MTKSKGQPRKPVSEKQKTGSINTTREKKRNQGAATMVAVPLEKYPVAPEGLGLEGKMIWDSVVRELKDLRVITAVDLFNLRAMCIEWECYIALREKQLEVGSYYEIKSDDGKAKSYQPHPVHYNGTNHLKEFTRIANDFGLSPASRLKMGVTTQDNTKSKAASMLKNAV